MVRTPVQSVAMSLLLLGMGWVPFARAAQGGTPVTRTVVLHPTRGAYLRIDFDYEAVHALPPFENEPRPSGKKMVRILIPTIPPTPVLRNLTDHELYLKPDHSPDFSAGSPITYRSRWDGHVLFEDLQISTQREAMVIPYTIQLKTYESACTGWFEVLSGWKGNFDLDGGKYTLGIVNNLDGQINGSDLLSLTCDKWIPRVVFQDCPVPQTLSFAGRTFRLDFAFKVVSSEVVLEATFTEVQPAPGNWTSGRMVVCSCGCGTTGRRSC